MFAIPTNSTLLFDQAIAQDLYQNLVVQINKDFNLANESLDVAIDVEPNELKISVENKIYWLIQNKFAEYLNLLYIIDVSEPQIKELDGSDIKQLSEQVAFLILKREWLKVWYRKNF